MPAGAGARLRLTFIALFALLVTACGGPWIRVQNVGTSPAQVTVTYYDRNGNQVSQDSREVAPGASATFSVASDDQVPRGYAGSAVVESDQPVVALRRTDMKGSARNMVDGETLAASTGGSTLYLPLVLNAAGAFNSWSSRINVQNLSASDSACVTLTFISGSSGQEVAWDPAKPSGSRLPSAGQCPTGTVTLAPLATLVREPGALRAPPGFSGSVRIDSSSTGSGTPLLSATVDTSNPAFNLLTSYRGLSDADLGTTVLLPLIERDAGPDGSYRTLFEMQSKNSTTAVTARLRFEGVDGLGNYVGKSSTVTFTGSQLCDQVADDDANCLAPGDTLPPGFSGYVSILASSPIAVVAQRGSYLADFGNYRGMPAEDGGRRVALPGIKRNSWLRIMPADRGAANVRIRYFGAQLPGGEVDSSFTAVQGVGTVFQANEPALPDNFDGSAIVESDRPVVVVAAFDALGGGDSIILYEGLTIP